MSEKTKEVTAEIIPIRDEEGNFLFRRIWLSNYSVIDGPMSKVALTVTNAPNLFTPDDGTNPRYIVNLKAVLKSDLGELKTKFGDAAYVRGDALNKIFLSATIWVNEGQVPELPMKGEKVLCNIDYVHSPALGKDVLRVVSIGVAPAKEVDKLDVAAMFADVDGGAFAEADLASFEAASGK